MKWSELGDREAGELYVKPGAPNLCNKGGKWESRHTSQLPEVKSKKKCASADKAYKFQIFSYISNIGTIPQIIKDKKRLLGVNLERAVEREKRKIEQ